MTTSRYKSDVTYSDAILKYYVFAFVASSFSHIPIGIGGMVMDAPPLAMMCVMALVQVTTWWLIADRMCLALESMIHRADNPPTLPGAKEKTNEVKGNGGVNKITRTTEFE